MMSRESGGCVSQCVLGRPPCDWAKKSVSRTCKQMIDAETACVSPLSRLQRDVRTCTGRWPARTPLRTPRVSVRALLAVVGRAAARTRAERVPEDALLGRVRRLASLGLSEDAAEETKALYAFVYGDLRRLPSDGLIACTFVPRSGGTRKSSSQRTSSCSISTERPPDKAAALRAALSLRTATCDRASPRITRPLSARAGSLFIPWRRLQLGDRAVDSQSPRVLVHAAGCGQLGSLPRRRRRLSYCSGW